ncbi:Glucose-6-phosphate 1-dehydrogenase [subsurface metagenome]
MSISNSAIVILGASGDLARGKLIPALAKLYEKGDIDSSSLIVGSGRSSFNNETFRSRFDILKEFSELLYYHRGISGLKRFIMQKGSFSRIIFFMALPPSVYAATAEELSREGFGEESILIIEKPYGNDYNSANKLNVEIKSFFDESQIFRIDHYLAKEAVQNILVFRFANSLFYPVWNSRYIESIQINAFESFGVENRGAYFDKAGIIRDMVQNHLMQLLSLTTMEAPVSLEAEDIRVQKISLLKAVSFSESYRYQYNGYRDEKDVADGSTIETYAELKLSINNFRWIGMPVYIRVGKALNRRGTEIGIRFKPLPRLLFNEKGDIPPNIIIFKIQPAEGIILDVSSKIPGSDMRITNTNMNFCYRDSFDQEIPEAYQRLLLDALRGDRTLFVSAEESELSWKKIGDFLDKGEVKIYPGGTVPESSFNIEWIDFEKYGAVCI